MKPFQFHLAEFMLAILFFGIFIALAVKMWSGMFFLQGLIIAAVVLLQMYLLLVVMRRHRGDREPPDA